LRNFCKANSWPFLVCAVERTIKTPDGADDGRDEVTEAIPVAGELKDYGGGHLDPKCTRLDPSDSNYDSKRGGLKIELNGGFRGKRKQKAVVEFLCDPNRTGTELDIDSEDKHEGEEEQPAISGSSLKFIKYDKYLPDTDVDVLWLEWYTKYACENQKDEDDAAKSGHWGFFTWFLIM
jgi:hypothetical protein